ncbi:MAG TPA: methyltransferase domain-containing protein [Acidimicrobiales bacterium]
MSDVRYDDPTVAREFEATRYRHPEVFGLWCDRMGSWFEVGPVQRLVLDVGAGTGIWSVAIAERFAVPVLGVEPAAGMRSVAATRAAAHPLVDQVAATAEALPLRDRVATAAWLSTVVHQFTDRPAALAELRRVLVPGAPVLVRTFLPERHPDADLCRHFPGARRFPVSGLTLDGLVADFERAGFRSAAVETVPEPRAATYDEVLAQLPPARAADSALVALTDEEWEAGLDGIRAAQARGETPPPFELDLLVFI